MAVDPETVKRIAELARLQVAADDMDELTGRLNAILAMVGQLQDIDTDGVLPMANPLDATQRLRPDQVTEPNQREHYQAIAPSTENGLYLVPRVIE